MNLLITGITALFMPLFFVLILPTLISIPFAIQSICRYSGSTNWMPVPAEVIVWKSSSSNAFDFKYEYSIDGRSYTSSVVAAYSFPFFVRAPKENEKSITVYVNPDKKHESIVYPGVIITWIGMFFAPLGFALSLYANRKIDKMS